MVGPKTEFLRRSEAEAGVRAAPVGPKAIAGGSAVVAVTGLAAVLLSIIGLSGAAPATVDSAAIVALGAAILLGGGAYLARIARTPGAAGVRGWFSAESFLGAVGAALAFLALIGPAPRTLTEVAVLVIGACAFFAGSVLAARLASALARRA